MLKRLSILICVIMLAACDVMMPAEPEATALPTQTPPATPTRMPPAQAEAAETPMPELAQQSALERIQDEGVLRVGVLYGYPPFGYLSEGGQPEGYEVELARMIAEAWEVDVEFEQVTRQIWLEMIYEGRVDMLAAAVPHTRDFEQVMEFSTTTFPGGYVAVVEGDPREVGVQTFSGSTVAVLTQEAADVIAGQAAAAGVTPPNVERFTSMEEAVTALTERDDLQYIVGLREQMMLAADLDGNLNLAEGYILYRPYAFAFRRGDVAMRDYVNLTLYEIFEGDAYAEMYRETIYGYAADVFLVPPGETDLTLTDFPTEVAVAESLVDRIRRGEPLRVAGLSLAESTGRFDSQPIIDGYNRAVINEMARRWGVPIEEVPDSVEDDGIALLTDGQADLVVGVRFDRAAVGQVGLSQPYYERALRIAYMEGVVVSGIQGFPFRPVFILPPYEQSRALIVDNDNTVEIREPQDLEEAFTVLTARAVDAAIGGEYTVGLMAQADEEVLMYEVRYRPTGYAMAMPQRDIEFRTLVDFTLQDMAADGTLASLQQQYFGPYFPAEEELPPLRIEVLPGDGSYLLGP